MTMRYWQYNEYQALLKGIRHNIGDDTPRLACADWLEEHDEPAFANFIRADIAYYRFCISYPPLLGIYVEDATLNPPEVKYGFSEKRYITFSYQGIIPHAAPVELSVGPKVYTCIIVQQTSRERLAAEDPIYDITAELIPDPDKDNRLKRFELARIRTKAMNDLDHAWSKSGYAFPGVGVALKRERGFLKEVSLGGRGRSYVEKLDRIYAREPIEKVYFHSDYPPVFIAESNMNMSGEYVSMYVKKGRKKHQVPSESQPGQWELITKSVIEQEWPGIKAVFPSSEELDNGWEYSRPSIRVEQTITSEIQALRLASLAEDIPAINGGAFLGLPRGSLYLHRIKVSPTSSKKWSVSSVFFRLEEGFDNSSPNPVSTTYRFPYLDFRYYYGNIHTTDRGILFEFRVERFRNPWCMEPIGRSHSPIEDDSDDEAPLLPTTCMTCEGSGMIQVTDSNFHPCPDCRGGTDDEEDD